MPTTLDLVSSLGYSYLSLSPEITFKARIAVISGLNVTGLVAKNSIQAPIEDLILKGTAD